jgi:hypothetical protein
MSVPEKTKVPAAAVREGHRVPITNPRSAAGIDTVAARLEHDVPFFS